MIEHFFEKLSYRVRSENALSDITWAVAESCLTFQKLFVQFFFSDVSNISKIAVFKREHTDEGSRPDFYIKIDNTEFVIECKINDRNHHFEQYKAQFPNARFGYITNYPLNYADADYSIRQWSEWKRYLEVYLKGETDDQTSNLITGYLTYLTNVCGIFTLSKMNLTNLSSLGQFNLLIKKIVSSIDNHESSLYNLGKNYDVDRSGQYFEVKKGNISIWPWLGVYYGGMVCIYLEFNEKWCRKIYDHIDLEALSQTGELYKAPYKNDDYGWAVCFELKETYFERFNHEQTTVEEQESLTRKFVNEVFAVVGIYLVDEAQ